MDNTGAKDGTGERDSDLHEFADSLRSDHARASGGETGERDHDSAPSRSRTEPSPVAKPLHLPLFPLCVSRLVNLWPPRSFSESVTKWVFPDDDSEERSKTARDSEKDEEDDTQQRGVSFTILSDISSLLFMGNLALFLGLLVIVFTLHILLASGIEAYWMAKVRQNPTAEHIWHLYSHVFCISFLYRWDTPVSI